MKDPDAREEGWSRAGTWLLGLIAFAVMAEWTLGRLWLSDLGGRFAAMAPVTALNFLALALGLARGPRFRHPEASPWRLLPLLLQGAYCLGIVLPWRASLAFPWPRVSVVPGAHPPYFGRMAPLMAGLFLAAVAAHGLRFRSAGVRTRRVGVAQSLSLLLLGVSLFLLVGFGLGMPFFEQGFAWPMAPIPAMCSMLLASLLLFAGPESWGRRWLRSRSLLARLTRAALPQSLLVVFLGAWLTGAVLGRGQGQGRLVLAALVTVLTAALVALVTGLVAARIQKEVDQGEAALRDREEDLRITLNSIGDGLLSVDAQGRILALNPAAASVTGWAESEAAGKHWSEVMPLRDAEEAVLERLDLLEQAPPPGCTWVLKLPGGREARVEARSAPRRDDEGHPVGQVVVLRDVTRQMDLEEKLRQAQKMEALGQLSGGVAHDFNNMLAGIHGGAELLALKLPPDSNLQNYVRMIKDGASRAADLTAKLLAFSRKGKVVSTGVDVHEIIRNAVELLEHSIDPRIRIDLRLAASRSVVVGDPAPLQNVILNLGINARDAMPEGGLLVIASRDLRLSGEDAPEAVFRLGPGTYLEVSVSDTGMGIHPDLLTRIFEPFFTTKATGQGTGLGLAMVYGAMLEHHGAVTVSSEMGCGTCFRLLLPLDAAPTHLRPAPEREAPRGHGRVLLVEDEPLVREVAGSMLESLGFTVLQAEDGLEGVRRFQETLGTVDLVILDMVMPRMGGRDTLLRLRDLDPHIKVLLCSGFDLEGHLPELMAMGAGGFLQKPYRRVDLTEAVQRLLGA